MELVIAEKPSVARSIAQVLGADKRCEAYLQGERYIVSWCVGHLVELAYPDAYDARYARWRYEDLPILPKEWRYTISAGTKKQFAVLRKLMHDRRFSTVICATDAGREGELIFRLVYEQAGCTLPVRRLWISSLEESVIREGFRNLKDSREYENLYRAALCRERADWLVGMNASRLYSLLYGQTLRIGRVMTPTLAMIAKREENIQTFRPECFFVVQLDCGFSCQSERFADRRDAERIFQDCAGQPVAVTKIEKKTKTENPPRLYDLTSLQRDANRIFGYTAQQTLDCAQSLYEKKLITYPRTDSRFLTKDMKESLPDLIGGVYAQLPFTKGIPKVIHIDSMIDDSKVTDHHAILPTRAFIQGNGEVSRLLSVERDILNLVCIQFLCAAHEPFRYAETAVSLECAGTTFAAKGKTVLQPGWKDIEQAYLHTLSGRDEEQKEQDTRLPVDLSEGQSFSLIGASVKEGKTTAPKRYTEGTILSSMESAGVEDMPEDAERKGIGTPATRAAILEKLIASGLVERKGAKKTKSLVPTDKGMALIAVVPEQIQSPMMTAEWEQRLKEIEHGKVSSEDFMRDIADLLTDLKEHAVRVPNASDIFPSGRENLGKCPACGAPVSETERGFFCENRACRFGIWKDNRFLTSKGKRPTADLVRKLLENGSVKVAGLKTEKSPNLYDAILTLDCREDGSARFTLSFPKK